MKFLGGAFKWLKEFFLGKPTQHERMVIISPYYGIHQEWRDENTLQEIMHDREERENG